MPLQRVSLDVPAIGGLQQKLAPQRLPIGKGAASAVNLVVNKAGRLEKRLGFFTLNGNDIKNTGFRVNRGLSLSTWKDDSVMCLVGAGTWPITGATVTALETYSDDSGAMVIRDVMPELKVVGDSLISGSGVAFTSINNAMSHTVVVYGDYLVSAWIVVGPYSISTNYPSISSGTVFYQVTEISTGNVVVSPTALNVLFSSVAFLRLVLVGSTIVLIASNNVNNKIYAVSMSASAGNWSWGNTVTLTTSNGGLFGAFDARAVTGDTSNFVLAFYSTASQTIAVQKVQVSNLTVVASASVNLPTPPSSTTVTALGIRAISGGQIAVCWSQYTTNQGGTKNPYTINAWVATYNTLVQINTVSFYTAATANEYPPTWLDVASNGNGGQLQFTQTFTVSWSPLASCWDFATYLFGQTNTPYVLLSGQSNPVKDTNFIFPDGTTFNSPDYRIFNTLYPENNARIIQCQFTYNGGWVNTCPIITPGVVLASRGLEANGIVYYLGWVPSSSQGSFVALALDISADPLNNSSVIGKFYPMRPVANLMTRRANQTTLPAVTLSGSGSFLPSNSNPNFWSGGSEWVLTGDPYGTSYVGYVSSSVDNKLLPAVGKIQTVPTTGFSSATLGTLTAFSGGIPTLFDGHNVFEQNFLYAPEGIVCQVQIQWGSNPTVTFPGVDLMLEKTFSIMTISNLQGILSGAVGQTITITGAQNSGNNGTFTITQVVNPSTVLVTNSTGTVGGFDPNNGSTSLQATLSASATTSGALWNSLTDSHTWVFCWEHFDSQGNLHQSARSTPITIRGYDLYYAGIGAIGISNISANSDGSIIITTPTPNNLQTGDYVTVSGVILNNPPPSQNFSPNGLWSVGVIDSRNFYLKGSAYSTSGTYQFNNATVQSTRFLFPFSGTVSFTVPALGVTMRMRPTGNNNAFWSVSAPPADQVSLACYRNTVNGPTFYRVGSVLNSFQSTTINFQDSSPDSAIVSNPLLYGDGTLGAPGSLDNFCPPATNVMVKHKERLFISPVDDNLVLFTKQQGAGQGPGYNEQVESFLVGDDDPIVGMESLDTNLIVLKKKQIYYVGGDGPADDGSGGFSKPQPIPTDSGCLYGLSIKTTPEGVYYQSQAGLRLVTRGLSVEYVGGPVEDELLKYPVVMGSVLYPQNNRLLVLANVGDTGSRFLGEVLVRDYVLDAWTTMVLTQSGAQYGFVSACVAQALSGNVRNKTLHLLTPDGQVWREHSLLDATPYFDNSTYVTSTWTCPVIKPPGDQGRFRLWDILVLGQSMDPHGIIVSVGKDYGLPVVTSTFAWSDISSGSTPLTQIRSYDGRMGEAFQVSIQDVQDPASSTGQGFQVLGYTLGIGAYPGLYKLPAGQTK